MQHFFVASLLLIALYLGSFPGENPEWCEWSNNLLEISDATFPTFMATRSWGGISASCIMIAVWVSPSIKRLLSSRILVWLGDISFGCFLLHGILLRTVLIWAIVFLDRWWSSIASPLKVVSIVAWWFVLVLAAQNWKMHVERRITKFIDHGLKYRLFMPMTGLQ